jgi:hypothetical protein
MLRTAQSSWPISWANLYVDEYVPFSFRANEEVLAFPFLWRTGNLKTTLIEIKIHESSHAILGVTVPIYERAMAVEIPSVYLSPPTISGVPVVDLEGWSGRRRDEPAAVTFMHNADSFVMVMNAEVNPETTFGAGRARFFSHGNTICAIGFFGLTRDEMRTATLPKKRGRP